MSEEYLNFLYEYNIFQINDLITIRTLHNVSNFTRCTLYSAATTTTTTRLNDRILLNVLERGGGEAAEEKRATEGDGGYKVIRGN